MESYTGIGSRKTPDPYLIMMYQIAVIMAKLGYCLRSGGAPGADDAFERGCDSVGGRKQIFLPWDNFNGRHIDGINYVNGADHVGMTIAMKHHPNWGSCGEGARKLLARNTHQIIHDGIPVTRVYCWTPGGELSGGTAQAIRIALHHDIPVYNLGLKRIRTQISKWIDECYKHFNMEK